MMQLSIVIVNYNVRYFLELCLLSVHAASKTIKTEIIVVDNASTDDSCEMLKQKFPEVKRIKNSENVGFSKANNQGVQIATGEFVLILNPDTVVAEDTFIKLIDFAKTKHNVGIVGVKLIDGSGNFLSESKRSIPYPQVAFNKLVGISSKRTGKYYATHLTENETGIVDVLVGAFMFLKRTIFNEVNGFDEDYFMYGEDIDLSYKVLNKGYKNYYLATTEVIHFKGESTVKDVKYLKYFYGAMQIFYKKHLKLNLIYDFIMSFGIEFWFLLKFLKFKFLRRSKRMIKSVFYLGKDKKTITYLNLNYVTITKQSFESIEQLIQEITNNQVDGVVFDQSSLTFKEIIYLFDQLKKCGLQYKIHPKKTHFVIGSTSSTTRGSVELIA